MSNATTSQYVDRTGAARYLCISVTTFLTTVKPFVPVYNLNGPGKRPMPRYKIVDLDAYMDSRRNETPEMRAMRAAS